MHRSLPSPDFQGNPAGTPLLRWWQQQTLFPSPPTLVEGRLWAVAFSGGADSTALLLAAHALWPGRVHALHVHHGLQSAADDFAAHATGFCNKLGVPLKVLRVQARHSTGQSPEDAARQARYRALAEHAQSVGALGVFLGQHAQDQAETLVLALTRGAGLPGLSAMPVHMVRHGMWFFRPLLEVDAFAIRSWLEQQSIPWIDDPTNADQIYTRNRIRAQLLPVLQQHFPAYAATFARSARHAAQAQELLEDLARIDLAEVGNPPRIRRLQALSRARQANVLRHWLCKVWQVAPSEAQMQAVLSQVAACTTRGHRLHLRVATGHVIRDGDVLAFCVG